MVEAVMLWNEPNNLSHWDFKIDPEWKMFAEMAILAAKAVRRVNPDLPIALGGISPIDPHFIRLMGSQGVLDAMDVIALHGFPLDWNHWNVNEWPAKLDEIRAVTDLPIWISEVGASSFGAEEVQLFGLQRMSELLQGRRRRRAVPTIDTTTWACCARMVLRNWPQQAFRKDWEFASGCTSKITAWTRWWNGCSGSTFVIYVRGLAGLTAFVRTLKHGSTGRWPLWSSSTPRLRSALLLSTSAFHGTTPVRRRTPIHLPSSRSGQLRDMHL